jgi:hypothetical protein
MAVQLGQKLQVGSDTHRVLHVNDLVYSPHYDADSSTALT